MPSVEQLSVKAERRRSLLVNLAVLFVGIAVGYQIRRSEVSESEKARRATLKSWKDGASTSISDVPKLRAFFRELQFRGKDQLSPQHLESLQNQLVSTFIAYSSGSFSNYLAYRYPSQKYQLKPGIEEQIIFMLNSLPRKQGASPVTETGFKLVERLWNAASEKGNLYCTQCWDRFDGKNTTVIMDENFTLPKKLKESIPQESNAGVMTFNPMAECSPTAEEVLAHDGKLVTATLSTIIYMKDDLAYPVYVQFYLVPESNYWIPNQLATAYSGDRDFDLLF